jgi:hypothetical protein
MAGPPKDYVEVSERLQEFRDKYPEGSLQAEIVELRDDLVIVKAYAYRNPDDPRPGTGLASEPIPGKTNFTRDSELMNAETSAWGRALIAVGAADAKRGIASANEVRNRQASDRPGEKVRGGREFNPPEPAAPGKPSHYDRVLAYLEKHKIAPEAMTAYLKAEFGGRKFGDLAPQHQEAIADGLEKSVLGDRLRELAREAA